MEPASKVQLTASMSVVLFTAPVPALERWTINKIGIKITEPENTALIIRLNILSILEIRLNREIEIRRLRKRKL